MCFLASFAFTLINWIQHTSSRSRPPLASAPPRAPLPPPPPSVSNLTHESNRELASILSTSSPHRRALPLELILQILSHPSRWILVWSDNTVEPTRVFDTEGSRILLSTPPLTARAARLFRKVVFTMRSHDQGWSSYPQHRGTFENSWTWFDVAVGRKSESAESMQTARGDNKSLAAKNQDAVHSPLDSPNIRRHRIQANRHAVSLAETYTVPLHRGHEIFHDLKAGDQILLVACARYDGWVNNVKAAGIEVWEEDDLDEWAYFGSDADKIRNTGTDFCSEDVSTENEDQPGQVLT